MITLNIPAYEQQLIQKASQLMGMSIEQFFVNSTVEKAKQVATTETKVTSGFGMLKTNTPAVAVDVDVAQTKTNNTTSTERQFGFMAGHGKVPDDINWGDKEIEDMFYEGLAEEEEYS